MNLHGSRISECIREEGRLVVKQVMPGKWIFNARIVFPGGQKIVGNISTTEDGALENLEGALKHEPRNLTGRDNEAKP